MRISAGAMVLLGGAALAPTAAHALPVVETVRVDGRFSGLGCGARDTFTVRAPLGAYSLQARRPHLNRKLRDETTGAVVARLQAARPTRLTRRRKAIRFTAVGSDEACADPAAYVPSVWKTEEITFFIRFRIDRRVYIHCLNRAGSRYVRRFRPTRCAHFGPGEIFGGGVNLIRIRWESWSGRSARGRAIERGFHLPFSSIPAKIRAYRPLENCGWAYTRLRATSQYGTTTVRLAPCPRRSF